MLIILWTVLGSQGRLYFPGRIRWMCCPRRCSVAFAWTDVCPTTRMSTASIFASCSRLLRAVSFCPR